MSSRRANSTLQLTHTGQLSLPTYHPLKVFRWNNTHRYVAKLLQDVFNNRPPTPKYNSIWSLQTVVTYLAEAGDKEAINKKLAMLLALFNAKKSSDLKALGL